jgi:hypothetical protein
VPPHHRMRGFDRDLIRGGHYGQRSCEPRSKAEHMAAPTKLCDVKILLANPEPSTRGTSATCHGAWTKSACGAQADISHQRPGGPSGQSTIAAFKINGEQLFFPTRPSERHGFFGGSDERTPCFPSASLKLQLGFA